MSISNNIDLDGPIGFFDSGVGGLTVLSKVKHLLPNENYIFYGDTIHLPYGDKTKKQLLEYSKPIFNFFEKMGCKAVVMACNTTSSVIYDDIKDCYGFKIYPVVQSVAKILSSMSVSSFGVFATKATIESGAYSNEIAKYNKNIRVYGQYCPEWVKIVENKKILYPESIQIIKSDLDKMLKNNPQKIVLGCTHYPYLLTILKKFLPGHMFIDPSIYLADFIKFDLEKSGLLRQNTDKSYCKFYVSSDPEGFKKKAITFYRLDKLPEIKVFD